MLTVVKIGGNVIDDKNQLADFLVAFSQVKGMKMLVHGGGKLATDFGLRLNVQPNYVHGRRITDKETLDLVTMVYGGLINKNLAAQLQALNCNAIGLTGADGNFIKSVKRPVSTIDYGYVGDVKDSGVDHLKIKQILDIGLIPVVAPLTHDGAGSMLNTNADTIAQELARAMAKVMEVQLIYCFEKNGVLLNAEDDESVIDRINVSDFEHLKSDGIITGGMIPKISNACEAVKAGVSRVVIGNAAFLTSIINGQGGTEII